MNNTVPTTWDLDLRQADRAAAEAAAEELSSRLYGTARGALHSPLTIRSDYASEVVVGVHISAVSIAGAELQVIADDEEYRLRWERADATHRPDTLYWFTLPGGTQTAQFTVVDAGGVVVVDSYRYFASVDDLPTDVTTEQLAPYVAPPALENTTVDGYRGIWFTLGQFSEYGDKYSGGLGTYTMKHSPLAVYAPEVGKTFFTYGGTLAEDSAHLLNMVSYYDHETHTVPRPTIVHDKGREGVSDPHDNSSIEIADDGHIWIFVSGRSTARMGYKYRSLEPYSVEAFERVTTEEMTYPQPIYLEGEGFTHLFTKYTQGRELYWENSDATGTQWTEDQKLAGFGGHYQASAERDGLISTAFNYHPGGNVDARTNVYFLQTGDRGESWQTADGTPVQTPLATVDNEALVVDYEAQGRLVYMKEVNFDRHGNPLVLYVTASDYKPGPNGDPRTWHVAHWDGGQWQIHDVTTSDHNYDSGSLYVDGDTWAVVAPTDPGPQTYQAGGEMVRWTSTDQGATWVRAAQITDDSPLNHSYARRPLDVEDPFYAFWADGDPTERSISHLYFGDSSGSRYWQLPYSMEGEVAQPTPMFDDVVQPPLLTVEAGTRCVVGRVVQTVRVASSSDGPVEVAVSGAYGARTVTVAPDGASSVAFSTRLGSVPAGEVSAVAGAGGASTPVTAAHPAHACGS